jgi:hypothetical protein
MDTDNIGTKSIQDSWILASENENQHPISQTSVSAMEQTQTVPSRTQPRNMAQPSGTLDSLDLLEKKIAYLSLKGEAQRHQFIMHSITRQ